ncbi:hypothetical protein V513_03055 [Mesotoga sp. H07.pep.5.3]|nr:hypothetical protein V513_03055 [Mesotoga sp. H07.pep.5.3]
MTAPPVILTTLLVRIWTFRFYEACTRKRDHTLSSRTCFGIFVLILSEDGGPLTDNEAFSSLQRVLVPKRTAVLKEAVSSPFAKPTMI